MTQFNYLITSNSIVLVFDGIPMNIESSHPNYKAIKFNIMKHEKGGILDIIKIKQLADDMAVVKQLSEAFSDSDGSITVTNNEVVCTIHGYKYPLSWKLTQYILMLINQNMSLKPIYNFIKNLAKNDDKEVASQLFEFLEQHDTPFTADGNFLAYKKITDDYKDIYTKTMDNSIGKVVSMPRFAVEKDPHKTCSSGLHVCAWSYLAHFGSGSGNRVVIVEVNPKDVVSIPTDYNYAKMRVCEYTVKKEVELTEELKQQMFPEQYQDEDDYEEDFYDMY